MSDWLPHLLRPYWLLALPLLSWLLWRLWHRQRRIGRWQRLLPPNFHAVLLTRGKLRNSRLPWLILGCAWLLACLALLGPSWQKAEQPGMSRLDPLVILLDLTPTMLASDVSPTRLQQAKRKVIDLLQARQDAQTAVVVYAGSAHTLVPLSNDMATAGNLLEVLTPDLMPEAGHRADLAVAQGIELLEHGANGRGRLLLIGSSLDERERSGIREQLEDSPLRLLILGIGTEQGAPIAREDGSFVKDERGAILIPRLDNNGMRRFATSIGGRYQQARLDEQDLHGLGLLDRQGNVRAQEDSLRLSAWLDQGHWLLLPLLLLAACAGRRGWLFCLALIVWTPQPGYAVTFQDLWLRPDQQGERLLESQRPAEAAERFEDPRWQGFARFLAGDYAGAVDSFSHGDRAEDHYNRGNALAANDQLNEAIEAYDQALELDPDLESARRNRALVEQALRERSQASQADDDQASPDADPEATAPDERQTEQPAAQRAAPEGDPGNEGTDEQEPPPPSAEPTDATVDDARQDEQQPAMAENGQAPLSPEEDQAMNQWLRKIPDNPGELLRRKFLYEQRKRQELAR